jgi:mannosyltransferase OCH1-like enzyme
VIPEIIHRLWLGPRPMPQRFREYGQRWRELNPGWVVHDWSWQDLPADLANEPVLDDLRARCTNGNSVELPTALADVIGYDLVAKFGGIYANCDLQPVRPLRPEMTDGRAWASWEEAERHHVVNAVFGGPPWHPFWLAVVAELPVRYFALRDAGDLHMNHMTGPLLLTGMYQRLPESLTVFGAEVFNPVHWSAIPPGETADAYWDLDALPGAVALHHWDHRRTGRGNVVS